MPGGEVATPFLRVAMRSGRKLTPVCELRKARVGEQRGASLRPRALGVSAGRSPGPDAHAACTLPCAQEASPARAALSLLGPWGEGPTG